MGIFPEKLKIAKVILNFSKFFEKVMHNRLTSYIERHEILYSLQFGF